MTKKLCGLIFFLITSVAVIKCEYHQDHYDYNSEATTKKSDFCPKPFVPPIECFSLEEIKDYGLTATALESLYNQYINLLTDARLTIDGDEVGFEDLKYCWQKIF